MKIGGSDSRRYQALPDKIVSGCMGMIKSRSIIPHSPTDHSQRTTPYHSGVTGIDITSRIRATYLKEKLSAAWYKMVMAIGAIAH
jgi:hypothetical protein